VTPRNAPTLAGLLGRLEGSPLAIELAAARAGVLTPTQMLERLSHRFGLLESRRSDLEPRHRSLWAAIDWSYSLLPAEVQRFLARLSVFRGGWDLEAAEAVCEEPRALEYLSQLRGHSLTLVDEAQGGRMRFRMLESLREYGAEQLPEAEREALSLRHVEYFLRLVEGAAPELQGQQQAAWLERLSEDVDNLRAALEWLLRHRPETALRLAAALTRFWWMRSYWTEARRWLTEALRRSDPSPSQERARALYAAGQFLYLLGEFEEGFRLLQESVTMGRTLGLQQEQADALAELGLLLMNRGDLPLARQVASEGVSLARESGGRDCLQRALFALACVALAQGDYASTEEVLLEDLPLNRELGNLHGIVGDLSNLALAAWV